MCLEEKDNAKEKQVSEITPLKALVDGKEVEIAPTEYFEVEELYRDLDCSISNEWFQVSAIGEEDFTFTTSSIWAGNELSFTLNSEMRVTIKKSAYTSDVFDVIYEFDEKEVRGCLTADSLKDAFKVFIDFHHIKADWVLEME